MTPLERARVAVVEETGAYRTDDGMWMREGGCAGDGYFDDIVRAVLTAIREPSEAMVDAAEGNEAINPRATTAHIYRAMIDAMLEEG